MSGASGITTKGSVTKNKNFSSVSLGYSTLCVLRHDAIQDVFFSGTYMYKTKRKRRIPGYALDAYTNRKSQVH